MPPCLQRNRTTLKRLLRQQVASLAARLSISSVFGVVCDPQTFMKSGQWQRRCRFLAKTGSTDNTSDQRLTNETPKRSTFSSADRSTDRLMTTTDTWHDCKICSCPTGSGSPQYCLVQPDYSHTLGLKKHVMISWTRTVHLRRFFRTLITKIGHRQVFLVSHLTYFVQLLYLGKLPRPKYHEIGLMCWFSQCHNTKLLTAKLSPYYFTYLLLNLRFN